MFGWSIGGGSPVLTRQPPVCKGRYMIKNLWVGALVYAVVFTGIVIFFTSCSDGQ